MKIVPHARGFVDQYFQVGMCWLLRTFWILSKGVWLLSATEISIFRQTAAGNFSEPRALNIDDRQDVASYQSNYYPYPSGPYPPPTYGPPPPPPPQGMVHIEFAFDEIVLRCIAEEPFEHIVWTKYQCPQQFLFGGEGIHVADGSNVHQDELYDVHIRGHDGTIISELLIKNPLADMSEGIYQCEVWPHIHGGGGYFPYNPYQNYNPPKSEVFIIGGNSLLEDCYHVSNFGSSTSKIGGITNKQSTNNEKDNRLKNNFFALKPRRNTTDLRKDGNSKQLRYNLKYVNNSLYNVEGVNVTAEFFRPSKDIAFNLQNLHNNVLKVSGSLKASNNFSNTNDFAGRNNDKFREIFLKDNARRGKVSNSFTNSSDQEMQKHLL